jgi:hypothetical protein
MGTPVARRNLAIASTPDAFPETESLLIISAHDRQHARSSWRRLGLVDADNRGKEATFLPVVRRVVAIIGTAVQPLRCHGRAVSRRARP